MQVQVTSMFRPHSGLALCPCRFRPCPRQVQILGIGSKMYHGDMDISFSKKNRRFKHQSITISLQRCGSSLIHSPRRSPHRRPRHSPGRRRPRHRPRRSRFVACLARSQSRKGYTDSRSHEGVRGTWCRLKT